MRRSALLAIRTCAMSGVSLPCAGKTSSTGSIPPGNGKRSGRTPLTWLISLPLKRRLLRATKVAPGRLRLSKSSGVRTLALLAMLTPASVVGVSLRDQKTLSAAVS